jgi:hypothetical protein
MIDFIIGLIYILFGLALLFICFKFIFGKLKLKDNDTITIKPDSIDSWAYMRFWGSWYNFSSLWSYVVLLIVFPFGFHCIASGIERMAGF